MRILGIDPGMASIGMALIDAGEFVRSWEFKTPADWARGERLSILGHHLRGVVDVARADIVSLEGYALGARFGREQMGEVGGVIRYVLREHYGCEAAVWQVKSAWKTVFGSGVQAKDTIRLQVFQRYGVDLKTTHEVDAFVVAMAEHLAQTGGQRPRPKKRKEAPAA